MLKSVWLKKYSSEVLTPPDATALARFETGNIVGDLACALFKEKLQRGYTVADIEIERVVIWKDRERKRLSSSHYVNFPQKY